MTIPVSLLYDLEQVPCDRPVGLLMRHSARFPITDPALNYAVGLTEQGVRMAEDLGVRLGKTFQPGRLLSSPVGRCLDTADAIARGANWPLRASADERLSHEAVGAIWLQVERGQVNGDPPDSVRTALRLLLGEPGDPRLDVMVTHDTVVGVVANTLLHVPITGPDWPEYLEGLLAWRDGERIAVRWRGALHLLDGI